MQTFCRGMTLVALFGLIAVVASQQQFGRSAWELHPVPPPSANVQHPGKVTGVDQTDLIPTQRSPLRENSQKSPKYVDFINTLYRFDRSKPSLEARRQKRAIIFRPMFVYKQQKVKKEKVKAEKQASKQPVKGTVPANQSQYYKDKQNHVYKEYNSFYEPYRYGQRYPYRNY